VSALQIRKANFLDIVKDALQTSGLEPQSLELEVVESVELYKTDQVIDTLQGLCDLKVGIAIDDFGTGFSSFSYIKSMSANKIKIDQSFIKGIIWNSRDAAITRGMISMAHRLSMEVVAEGVETAAHAAFLRRMGCDTLQGYYFSRPMPYSELVQFMSNHEEIHNTARELDKSGRKTLLLLDNEPNVLSALRRTFRGEGYRILTTTKVSEALTILAENEVEVIISDQRMPEMSGAEFFSQVKAIHPSTVRIVLSGYTDFQSVTDAVNRGSIYKFLTKPWEDNHIREHVQQAFQYCAVMKAGRARDTLYC